MPALCKCMYANESQKLHNNAFVMTQFLLHLSPSSFYLIYLLDETINKLSNPNLQRMKVLHRVDGGNRSNTVLCNYCCCTF